MDNTKKYKKLDNTKNEYTKFQNMYLKYIHWKIRHFFEGVYNIIKWIPTIYKDKDWDQWHIYNMLEKKLLYTRNNLLELGYSEKCPFVNRDITICLNLISLLKDESYTLEYQDYCDEEIVFTPVENTDTSKLDIILHSETYDAYFKSNMSTYRNVLKYLEKNKHRYSVEITDKGLQARTLSRFKHDKARKLLFSIMESKIEQWWD